MAERVVDGFETVEIDNPDRELAIFLRRPRQTADELGCAGSAVPSGCRRCT
ncbi:MAG TPA: hypothetical protein VL202_25140 [Pararhizobium sp.]|nr:hypothetical protein [Pararhizobium sp.]